MKKKHQTITQCTALIYNDNNQIQCVSKSVACLICYNLKKP